MRVFIACSAEYRNRKAILEALGSIFLETIDGQREYFYFDCPAITEIFDDGVSIARPSAGLTTKMQRTWPPSDP
jgi:hypothetical protein